MMRIYWVVLAVIVAVGVCFGNCPKGDVTGDCKVTFADYAAVAEEWLDEGCCPDLYPTQDLVEGEESMHLKLSGMNQGQIRGNCTIAGREDTIVVTDYRHEIEVPTDPASGLATGQRLHRAITIYKYTDQATPKLLQALVTGERMSQFALEFYRARTDGSVELCYRVSLENAMVVHYEGAGPNVERFSFSYESIEWEWIPDGVSSEDDWRTPLS